MNDLPWEDSLLERKTESYKDEQFLQTFVAFANSVRPEETAIVLIGEDNNGNALGVSDPDKFQIKVRKIVNKIYPALVWHQELYVKDGKTCVRVEIKYSGETPHFGGIAWVRKGSESIKASDEVFQKLIELRSGKVRELMKWLGKDVSIKPDESMTISGLQKSALKRSSLSIDIMGFHSRWYNKETAKIISVDNFWVTFQTEGENKTLTVSEPLEKIILSFDHEENTLLLLITP